MVGKTGIGKIRRGVTFEQKEKKSQKKGGRMWVRRGLRLGGLVRRLNNEISTSSVFMLLCII